MRFNTYGEFLAYHEQVAEIAAGVQDVHLKNYYEALLQRLDHVMTWWDTWSWDLLAHHPESLASDIFYLLKIPIFSETDFRNMSEVSGFFVLKCDEASMYAFCSCLGVQLLLYPGSRLPQGGVRDV